MVMQNVQAKVSKHQDEVNRRSLDFDLVESDNLDYIHMGISSILLDKRS